MERTSESMPSITQCVHSLHRAMGYNIGFILIYVCECCISFTFTVQINTSLLVLWHKQKHTHSHICRIHTCTCTNTPREPFKYQKSFIEFLDRPENKTKRRESDVFRSEDKVEKLKKKKLKRNEKKHQKPVPSE